MPAVAELNVRRLINETMAPLKVELKAAERAMQPVIAEKRRRERIANIYNARAQEDSLLLKAARSAANAAAGADGTAAPTDAQVHAQARMRAAKEQLHMAMGREQVLRELDRSCPRGSENQREARAWLPRALDALEDRLTAELEGPRSLVARVEPYYTSRKAVKQQLIAAHDALKEVCAAAPRGAGRGRGVGGRRAEGGAAGGRWARGSGARARLFSRATSLLRPWTAARRATARPRRARAPCARRCKPRCPSTS